MQIIIPMLLMTALQAQTAQTAIGQPQIHEDKLFAQFGRCVFELSNRTEYIIQLQAHIAELEAKIKP